MKLISRTFFEKYFPFVLFLFLGLLMIVLAFMSPGFSGGTDNINHYFISHYAFKYPHLFLDPWGRQLFTILSSPFAAIGFKGLVIFNVLAGMLTAWLCFLIAKKLEISPSYLALIFVVFMPYYCLIMLTCLTEILFSLVLVLAIYLFFRNFYISSAIVISFLPYARTEGYFILLIFVLAFILKRKYKPILFFLSGFLFFSIAGSFYYHDFFWIIHNPVYPIHHPVYQEKGDFFFYFRNYKILVGKPLILLLLSGTLILICQLFSKDPSKRISAFWQSWMILIPFSFYFLLHSFLYWQALGGSMGVLRVIAAVLPLGSLICLKGYEWIVQKLIIRKWVQYVFLVGVVVVVIIENFSVYRYPVSLEPEESLVKETAMWLKDMNYNRKKVFFNDLKIPFYLDKDPFDPKVSGLQLYARFLTMIPDSTIYVWDAHFSPYEYKVPLDSVMQTPDLRLIKIFRPKEDYRVYGKGNFEIYVFRKIHSAESGNNYHIKDSLEKEEVIHFER